MKLKIVRKKFLKENCGDSAMPIGVEAEPVLDPIADLENMSSQDAYNAGYNSAIQEISAMLSDLEFGGIPVDTAIPVGIEAVDQLEEEDDWIQKAVNPDHEGYCTPMTKKTCTPPRKALAKRFKKAAKKEDAKGGTGWEGKV